MSTETTPTETSETTPMRMRAFRVDDATWFAALAKAQTKGENLSDVIRRELRRYATSGPTRDARGRFVRRD